MFSSTARRVARQLSAPPVDGAAVEAADPASGRHHRAAVARRRADAEARTAAVARAHRRLGQIGACDTGTARPAVRSGPRGDAPEASRRTDPLRIDNLVARRDPLTRPFPRLPGARPAASGPLPASGRATATVARA